MSSVIQPSFSKGELSPELYGRVDTASYKTGLATARNMQIRTQGGAINRAGLEFVGLATNNGSTSRLRRFRFNTTDTYMLEFSGQLLRVIRDDAFVTEGAKAILGATQAQPVVLHVTAHGWAPGDDIEINDVVGMIRLNSRRFRILSVPDADHVALQDPITSAAVNGGGFAAYVSGGTAARVYTLATPYIEADLKNLTFVQSASVMTINHPSYDERRLTRTGDAAWTLTVPTFTPSIAAPTGLGIVVNSAGTVTASYVVTAQDATTGEESVASAPVTSALTATPSDNTVSWSAVTGAALYSVYKAVNGVYGLVGTTPNLSFEEVNMAPSLAITPPTARNPFSGAGDKPAVSTYYQQRHIRGGSLNNPDTLYCSQTANFYNLSISQPSQADDAITAALVSDEVNQIRHMVPMKDLIVFTAGAEWRINSNGQGFAADTFNSVVQSKWGCSHLQPILIGLTTIFVPENQKVVRTARYTYLSDSYAGEDLTLLSNHLFRNLTLDAWAFGRSPDPIAFGVRSDGTATALTYQEEQQVTAWTRWDTAGKFEDVDVVKPSAAVPDDVPYFVITRMANGVRIRTVERLHSRRYTDVRDCFFVDSGLSYDEPVAITDMSRTNPVVIRAPSHGFANGDLVDVYDMEWVPDVDDVFTETQPDQLNTRRYTVANATADTIDLVGADGSAFNAYVQGGTLRAPKAHFAGLDHLEGRVVIALADGNVVEDLTVVDGAVTLPFAASRAHIGLRYISDLETLDLEVPQGTIQGRLKDITHVDVKFNESRGLFMGPTVGELTELKQREFEPYGDPVDLFSGTKRQMIGSEWNTQGRVFLRQIYPLPMEVLAVIPDVNVED